MSTKRVITRLLLWLITYMLLTIALVAVLGMVYQRTTSAPAWDGTFECRPGETYTIKECP